MGNESIRATALMHLSSHLSIGVQLGNVDKLLFAAISGSHLYGFESANSDIDVRGIHRQPLNNKLGFILPSDTFETHDIVNNIEVETVTWDVGKYALMLLKGNGNALEQLYSPLCIHRHTSIDTLAGDIVPKLITKQLGHHYLGFADHEWRQVQTRPTVKKILYTFRTLLSGIVLMRDSVVIANLPTLLDCTRGDLVLPFIHDLIATKRNGYEGTGYIGRLDWIEPHYINARNTLLKAREDSLLPNTVLDYVRNQLNEWVINVRKGEI